MVGIQSVKNVVSRIKWRSVGALLILIAVVLLLLNSIKPGYTYLGNVGVKATLEPDEIMVGERATLRIEVANINKDDDVTISVAATARNQDLVFEPNLRSDMSEDDVRIGPKESRILKFVVRPKGEVLEGKYRIDVVARESSMTEGAEEIVYLYVKTK